VTGKPFVSHVLPSLEYYRNSDSNQECLLYYCIALTAGEHRRHGFIHYVSFGIPSATTVLSPIIDTNTDTTTTVDHTQTKLSPKHWQLARPPSSARNIMIKPTHAQHARYYHLTDSEPQQFLSWPQATAYPVTLDAPFSSARQR
jgi:hypothetical protein